MKLFTAEQIRAWDQYTIEHTPISSLDLMERAAQACVQRILKLKTTTNYLIFCGPGNNGGDGLAIARLLKENNCNVEVVLVQLSKLSENAEMNLECLIAEEINVTQVTTTNEINWAAHAQRETIIIDALFGTGLNRPLDGEASSFVSHINALNKKIISIDLPSGLFADKEVQETDAIIKAWSTITFQVPKRTFFYASSKPYIGEWYVEDIGLLNAFVEENSSSIYFTTLKDVAKIYKPRTAFSHKGNFGKGLLMAGSYGMMGSAVLASKACLRSGIGLLKVYTPRCGYEIMQTSVPEAMVLCDKNTEEFTDLPLDLDFNAIAIGPGWSEGDHALQVLTTLLKTVKLPMVIDAGALNVLSRDKSLLAEICEGSILTPHPKEFERLAGKKLSRQESEELALQWAKEYNICFILKGKNSAAVLPDGTIHYNSTGNPGMAKGGSGDCLTGILLALLAQGYSTAEAAIMSVYMHGYAGDRAASYHSQEAMLPSDLIDCIGEFFEKMNTN